MSRNFIDRFYEENSKDRFWSLNKKIGAGLFVLFLTVIMINTTGCTQNGADTAGSEEPVVNIPQPTAQEESVKVGNDGKNAAIAPDAETPAEMMQEEEDAAMVQMSVAGMGRSDPFLPESEIVAKHKPKSQYADFLAPPPESIVVDTTATEVMTTKVSGIMYDKLNPSAILNISGADYLVRTGDIINGYKILSIAKDTVTVQFGANVYKASVGELFTGEGINYNTVSNLENKFGSRNNKH